MNLSIYNMDTGKEEKSINAKIGDFISISPNKMYALYEETRSMVKTNDELVKDIKLVNLITGEVTGLKTQYKNYEAEYQWVDDNKLFVFYPHEDAQWEIIDLNGRPYKSGKIINTKPNYNLVSVKILNAMVSEDKTTGTLILNYIIPSNQDGGGNEFLMVDIATNEEKSIYTSKGFASFTTQNNIVSIGEYCAPNSKFCYFDEKGIERGEFELEGRIDTGNYSISMGDYKIAFCEITADSKNSPYYFTTKVYILNLKNKDKMKVFQTNNIVSTNSMNISWNSIGTALNFNVTNKMLNLNDTYVIRIR